jgi:hypothetical protein
MQLQRALAQQNKDWASYIVSHISSKPMQSIKDVRLANKILHNVARHLRTVQSMNAKGAIGVLRILDAHTAVLFGDLDAEQFSTIVNTVLASLPGTRASFRMFNPLDEPFFELGIEALKWTSRIIGRQLADIIDKLLFRVTEEITPAVVTAALEDVGVPAAQEVVLSGVQGTLSIASTALQNIQTGLGRDFARIVVSGPASSFDSYLNWRVGVTTLAVVVSALLAYRATHQSDVMPRALNVRPLEGSARVKSQSNDIFFDALSSSSRSRSFKDALSGSSSSRKFKGVLPSSSRAGRFKSLRSAVPKSVQRAENVELDEKKPSKKKSMRFKKKSLKIPKSRRSKRNANDKVNKEDSAQVVENVELSPYSRSRSGSGSFNFPRLSHSPNISGSSGSSGSRASSGSSGGLTTASDVTDPDELQELEEMEQQPVVMTVRKPTLQEMYLYGHPMFDRIREGEERIRKREQQIAEEKRLAEEARIRELGRAFPESRVKPRPTFEEMAIAHGFRVEMKSPQKRRVKKTRKISRRSGRK